MSGQEVYQQLREIDPDVNVLFCRGYFAEDLTAENGHIKGFINKTLYRGGELVEMVRAVLLQRLPLSGVFPGGLMGGAVTRIECRSSSKPEAERMTESDWLQCTNPWVMFPVLGSRAGDRKNRLLLCACCRHCLDVLTEPVPAVLVDAVALAERYADGLAGAEQLVSVQTAVVAGLQDQSEQAYYFAEAMYPLGYSEPLLFPAMSVDFLIQAVESDGGRGASVRAGQCRLLREIFGNPFRPDRFDSRWRSTDAVAIAREIDAAQTYQSMPILGDALEDAGCDHRDILDHCRHPSEHVRGCWVVDLVLEKT
jgi:hypothetical protein